MSVDEIYLRRYLAVSPIPLGLIRAIDCRYVSSVDFNGTVLDVGCGDGLFAQILFNDAKNRIDAGIDRDIGELKKAQKTGVYKMLVNCDITSLPFRVGTYDIVLGNSVLEHVRKLDAALSEISKMLKPGGKFILTVPSHYLSQQFLFSALLNAVGLRRLARLYAHLKNKAWKHYHVLTTQAWIDTLAKHGFKVIVNRYIHPREVTQLCDVFFISGLLSLVWKKTIRRYLLFPGRVRGMILGNMLSKYYHLDREIGSTIFMIAEKVA